MGQIYTGESCDLTHLMERTVCSIENVCRLEEKEDVVKRFLQWAKWGIMMFWTALWLRHWAAVVGTQLGSLEGPGGHEPARSVHATGLAWRTHPGHALLLASSFLRFCTQVFSQTCKPFHGRLPGSSWQRTGSGGVQWGVKWEQVFLECVIWKARACNSRTAYNFPRKEGFCFKFCKSSPFVI